MGLSLSDYVVTEAGFGFDLGAEKFLDIKCVSSGLEPQVAVLVATVRALKYHGEVPVSELNTPDAGAVRQGMENLEKHVENMMKFNVCPVVAVNRFANDTDDEIRVIQEKCHDLGVKVAVADVWARGGAGAEELARLVADAAENCTSSMKPLYDWNWPVEKRSKPLPGKFTGRQPLITGPRQRKTWRWWPNWDWTKRPFVLPKHRNRCQTTPNYSGGLSILW